MLLPEGAGLLAEGVAEGVVLEGVGVGVGALEGAGEGLGVGLLDGAGEEEAGAGEEEGDGVAAGVVVVVAAEGSSTHCQYHCRRVGDGVGAASARSRTTIYACRGGYHLAVQRLRELAGLPGCAAVRLTRSVLEPTSLWALQLEPASQV